MCAVRDVTMLKNALLRFKLPQKGTGQLAALHPMPRESRITFEEEAHVYTIDGKPAPRSVTGLLHEYASHFDASRAVAVMKGSRDWEMKRAQFDAQGLGVADDDFVRRWSKSGEVARARGTLLH